MVTNSANDVMQMATCKLNKRYLQWSSAVVIWHQLVLFSTPHITQSS